MKDNLKKVKKKRRLKEILIEKLLFLSAFLSVFITVAIVIVLFREAFDFFKEVSIFEAFTGTKWTPLFATKKFGMLPLISGTLLTTGIALLVALSIGLITAIYLNEYASHKLREIIKPILEVLAAVPTVIYGYFALLFLTPLLQKFIPGLAMFNALSPGIVMGIMIVPYVSSISEDAMRAVPMHLREASYAMGATKLQTALRVVVPAAFSGIMSAFILGISRAIGETMIVAIAAGMRPNFTLNPLETIQTMTAFIVQVSLGDTPHGTLEYKTIFAVGITLFMITFIFNTLSFWLRKRMKEAY